MRLIRTECEIINLDAFISARRSADGNIMTVCSYFGKEISLKGDDALALWEALSLASSTPQEIRDGKTSTRDL